MIPAILSVEVLDGYRLRLEFTDGVIGTVDLSSELWGPVFEPLREPNVFALAAVDPELETVVWPNGADLAPEYLYAAARREVGGCASRSDTSLAVRENQSESGRSQS
jgi:hypothetical protein